MEKLTIYLDKDVRKALLNLFTEDSENKDRTLSDSEVVNKVISEYLESEGITVKQEGKEEITVSDYDNAWKEAIETYFEEFMLFFFPHIHKDIDFSKDFTFLDKELQKIVKDSDDKKRYADKLVRVCLRNGKEKLILIHIEVQAGKEEGFETRVFTYNYRIFDRYREEVVSLVILADDDRYYRPDLYELKRWDFSLSFRFPIVKLLDYRHRIDIENAANPFEILTFAHLKNLETGRNFEDRKFWKSKLVKLLYKKGFTKKDVLNLYKFIDYIMELPEMLSEQFKYEMHKFEEGLKMPYVTSIERLAKKEGFRNALDIFLDTKFKNEALSLKNKIREIKEPDKLSKIAEAIFAAESLDDVRKVLEN